MKNFPETFNPTTYNDLKQQRLLSRQVAYLRHHIYESMLKNDFSIPENCSISVQEVPMGQLTTFNPSTEAVKIIVKELTDLGWKVNIGYGGNVLWVYYGDQRPRNYVVSHEI
jgi:hypothetical protein